MKRLFLAVPVTLFDYQGFQDDFNAIVQGRWVPQQNLHLTLKFFGDRYEKEYLTEIISALPLRLESSELKGLCVLPSSNILYAQTNNSTLSTLYAQLKEALMLYEEERFVPHVTLMRIKTVSDQIVFEKKLKSYEAKTIGVLQEKIQLIQSVLTPSGAEYTLIKEF